MRELQLKDIISTMSGTDYLNFQAAHFPYSNAKMTKYLVNNFIPRSEIKQENKDWVTATYWNAIASADWGIGEIINHA